MFFNRKSDFFRLFSSAWQGALARCFFTALLLLPTFVLAVGPPTGPVSAKASRSQPAELDAVQTQIARAQLRYFLNQFPLIRFHIVKAAGNGHQVANLRAIERLRELGFTGRIQALYVDEIAPKLAYLVPHFDAQQTHQSTQNSKLGTVEWVADSVAAPIVANEKASLGVQGATDRSFNSYLLQQMHVENFLQLQPRLWYQQGTMREIVLKTNESISLDYLAEFGAVTVDHPIRDWDQKLQETMHDQPALQAKIPFLSFLKKQMPQIDLLPAYSVDYPFSPDQMMDMVLNGLQRAVHSAPQLFNKPIFIPVFSSFDDQKKKELLATKLAEMQIPYLDATAATTLGALEQVQAGQIVFVQVGSVPNEIFDAVFRQATLPALLEGKNLTSTMIDAGLPYLNVIGSTVDVPKVRSANLLSADSSSILRNAFNSLDSRRYAVRENDINAIAKYFSVLKDPASELSQFVSSWKNDAQSLNRDLVGQSLLELKTAMESRHLVPLPDQRPPRCAQIF